MLLLANVRKLSRVSSTKCVRQFTKWHSSRLRAEVSAELQASIELRKQLKNREIVVFVRSHRNGTEEAYSGC